MKTAKTRASRISLSSEEVERYRRQIMIPEIGRNGQKKLKAASVLVVGLGGLGSPAAIYLAAAGIGRIGLVDSDRVERSNLQRQILHSTPMIGRLKTESACQTIQRINPHVHVNLYTGRLDETKAARIIRLYDIVVDGSDNFTTRYLVNESCAALGKPFVFGSVFQFEGQMSLFDARVGPCYQCLFPKPPPAEVVPPPRETGVFGTAPGLIGILEATEAVKWVLGKGQSLIGRLVLYDALTMKFREMRIHKNPACPVCGRHGTARR